MHLSTYFSLHAEGRLQATVTSAQEISTDKFEQTEAFLESNPPQSACELTGFPPLIDRIFPSSTS